MNALPTFGSSFLALAFGFGISISPVLGAMTTNAFQRTSNVVSIANTNFGRLQSREFLTRATRPATNTLSSTSTNAVVSSTNRITTTPKWTRKVPVSEQGASIRHTRLPAWLSPNLNVQEAVRLRLPDGSLLKSTVVGLGYYDTASGTSVVLATVKDSALEPHGTTQFIYRDAFQGVKADVRYRFGDNFFEQDVILREQPRSPSEWGLNPDTTLLEVLTETYSPPTITTETNTLTLRQESGAQVKSTDETLRLGGARIVGGQAFELPEGTNATVASAPVPVAKSLVETEGRKFLIEAVDYRAVEVPIQRLPSRSGTNSASNVRASTNRLARALPTSAPTVAGKVTPRLAGITTPTAGFVLDYIIVGESITNTVWFDDTLPGGPYQEVSTNWTWVTNAPAAVSGSNCLQQASASNQVAQSYFLHVAEGLSINGGDVLYCWVYVDSTNPPSEVLLRWVISQEIWEDVWISEGWSYEVVGYDEENDEIWDWVEYGHYDYQLVGWDEDWTHEAYWGVSHGIGSGNEIYQGALPTPGQWVRLEVLATAIGLGEGAYVNGMTFEQFGGKCAFDYVGKLNTNSDIGWVNDAIPAGAYTTTHSDTWTWITNNPTAQLGTNSHRSIITASFGQHWFEEATATLTIGASNALYCWVYLNPTNRPNEIMLQWSYGEEVEVEVCDEYDEYDNCISSHWEWIWQANWEHRAYWGADTIHTSSTRVYMGPLPPTNGWVRLEVPASKVNLEGREIYGMAFAASTGTVTWDNAGVTRVWSSDRDGDGLEDEWEIANGLNPWLNDAFIDSDGDGTDDLTEVLQGRDPHKGTTPDISNLLTLQVFPLLR